MQTAASSESRIALRCAVRDGRGAGPPARGTAATGIPVAGAGTGTSARRNRACASAGSTAGSPGRAATPTVSPWRAGSTATRITPTAASTTPASWRAAGRSPAAMPTANGIRALVALIGATMLIVPMASAL